MCLLSPFGRCPRCASSRRSRRPRRPLRESSVCLSVPSDSSQGGSLLLFRAGRALGVLYGAFYIAPSGFRVFEGREGSVRRLFFSRVLGEGSRPDPARLSLTERRPSTSKLLKPKAAKKECEARLGSKKHPKSRSRNPAKIPRAEAPSAQELL